MVKRVGERVAFQGNIFTLKHVDFELEGKKITYEIAEKNDTAMMVPLTKNGSILFVKEYFAAINEHQLGLPKGRVENSENPLETANKELQEEIGYKAGKLAKLGVLTITPGYFTQKTHVFLATELTESKILGDELEELEVIEHPLAKFEELIGSGQLTEARMIAALYMAKKFLDQSP